MHAHGGPNLGTASFSTIGAELVRWNVVVAERFAWAGSSYRHTGYGVRSAAEDTENLRQIFVQAFGQPRLTIMHGQSWGGNIAAKVIELYGANTDGSMNYDGSLLTSGVVSGGSRAYYFRLDLRAVYQYYCQNHPLPDEPQYPLWMGLPPDSTLRAQDLQQRANDCTGYQLPAGERSERQRENLANILNVIRIPERTFYSHLAWGTFHFQDLIQRLVGGRNPFPNRGVRYNGSTDDRALNRGVARYRSDREAVEQLSYDSDLTGEVAVPMLSMHAIDDPTVFVEVESAYRETLEAAGTADHLVQLFTDESEHSVLSTSEYATVLHAVVDWVETGRKPEYDQILSSCEKFRETYQASCHFNPEFRPNPLESRVYPRHR
jgi:alpha-beta hydrolase superfamily lysophospholipase